MRPASFDPALGGAGFRVLAPDQRGYGGTDRPADVAASDIHHLTADLVGVRDASGIERAVFVGHDWGGLVAWMMPLLHPARVAGVAGVNTPYFPHAGAPPVELMRQVFGDNHYIVHFQQPGVADAALARDVGRVFTQLMRRAVSPETVSVAVAATGMRNLVEIVEADEALGEPLLADDELRVYVETFERTGFTGGIDWYRNMNRNWETTPHLAEAAIGVPALMVTAEWDPVLTPQMAEGMERYVPDLERRMIGRCGHWTQQEKAAELNAILLDWLSRRA